MVAAALFLFDGMIGLSEILAFFVHIHAEAYMFTLTMPIRNSI
jgi:hypothetical protein